MKKYTIGFVLGLSIGLAAAAFGGKNIPSARGMPVIGGQSGDLFGWTVIVKHKTACKSPYMRIPEREIECLR